PDQWQIFTRTGVNHLMSISGLHVTMVSGLVYYCAFALWRRSRRAAQLFPAHKAAVLAGLCAAFVYALLAGFSVPTQRTFYMLAVLAAALWLGRLASASLVLCFALLAVALFDPWAVLAPGFWLSFGAVAVIMFVTVGRIGKPHWLRAWSGVQWAITIVLTPLLLLMFQQLSIISPLANAFAIPWVSWVVVPLTLLGAVLPLDVLLVAAHQMMAWCGALLGLLSAMPEAVWQQHAPPAWAVLGALLGGFWLLLPRGFPARWVGVVLFLPAFLVLPARPADGALWLTVLDVGQGLAVVAQTRRHALLYDTGPMQSAESDAGGRTIVPYLRGVGIRKLEGLIVSHDDIDHSGGALSILDEAPIGWLVSSLPENHPIAHRSVKPMHCYAGQAWVWDGVRFEILHPSLESYANPRLKDNDRSCVLKVASRFGTVLLPGDIERAAESELVQRAGLAADIMVVPHHGSRTSSTPEFITAVNPSLVIFTVGHRNRYGHPKRDIVARYERHGSLRYRTDQSGAITLRFDSEDGYKVQTYRRERPRYWREKIQSPTL
ncbi:MAG: DNA internalization-related competence protein ComEC/Rec2, partial [Burkholderiales bacterium]